MSRCVYMSMTHLYKPHSAKRVLLVRSFSGHQPSCVAAAMNVLLQIAIGNNGKPADLATLKLVPLNDRQQCDGCASCITDVHRTCQICGYDACIRCCRNLREQNKVQPSTSSIHILRQSSQTCYL